MKKLLMFLLAAIPIIVVLIVKMTASIAIGDVFVSVERVEILPERLSGMVGEYDDVTCNIYPAIATNKEVVWASSDERVVTIDEKGHVEYVGIGTGYITASAKDGNMRAECPVYVYDTKVHRVELRAPQRYVQLGGRLQLSATVLPSEAIDKSVRFESSDEDVATVDTNGLVYGVSEGDVVITVITEDGDFRDFVNLSVIKPVSRIVVKEKEKITSAEKEQIEYIIEPDDATIKRVTFEVDDESVATVDEVGVVTFLRAGEVHVKIRSVDGGAEEEVQFIYTGGYAYDLMLAKTIINLQVGDAAKYIEYETKPNVLTKTSVMFKSEDETVAYVDDAGYLHAVKGGSTIVKVWVQKSETETIERQIYVHVDSPATEIEAADVITAKKEVRLEPKSKPDDSTNEEYFYHVIDSDRAEVTADGLVRFLTDEAMTVTVRIYANEDESDVWKDVKVTYTAGGASSFELLADRLEISYGQEVEIGIVTNPVDADKLPIEVTLEEVQPVVDGGEVIEISGRKVRGVGGGTARVKVSLMLFNGEKAEKFCEIEVKRAAEEIEIQTGLGEYKGRFVTSKSIVKFSGVVKPADVTNKEIKWEVSDRNVAVIVNDELRFNQVGTVTLTAIADGATASVEISYVGPNPVYAEVEAVQDGTRRAMPEKIQAGESFEVELSMVIPQYDVLPNLSVEVINQKAASGMGKVLEVEGRKVTGISGGKATLVVYVSGGMRLNFPIEVERLAQSLRVLQANTQVTTTVVELISEVLPQDCTNKAVRYEVQNKEVAEVEGSTLTFKRNGVAKITAISESDESVRLEFFVEKVEKNTVHVEAGQNNVSVNKGELISFDIAGLERIEIESMRAIVPDEEVVCAEGERYLRATGAGEAKVVIVANGERSEIDIQVKQLVERIEVKNQIDREGGLYVVGRDEIDLSFEVYPEYAADKEVEIEVIQSERIAYVEGTKIYFLKAGEVTLKVTSRDGNVVKVMQMRCTGGEAIDAQLNVGATLVMDIGERVQIGVSRWIPFDLTNTRIRISEASTSGKKVIEIDERTRTIVAKASGEARVVVELSGGVVKEIEVLCVNKVQEIEVEEAVLISDDHYEIVAQVKPTDATNKNLEYILQETNVANIDGNVLHFLTSGTATVLIRTTDGTNIEKVIRVTCTMGQVGQIELKENSVKIEKGKQHKIEYEIKPFGVSADVKFEILEQEAYDGHSDVIELTEDGTILALCRGRAKVKVFAQGYAGEIAKELIVEVDSPIKGLNIVFDGEMEMYQKHYVTSRSEIGFSVATDPEDVEIERVECEAGDSKVAKVEDGKIKFLQRGMVKIVFKVWDTAGRSAEKTCEFWFTGEDLIEAELDREGIDSDGEIRLEAGEQIEFKLKRILPEDNNNVKIEISEIEEERNAPQKEVARFDAGTLFALNGGRYKFRLQANGVDLGRFTLIVTREATAIEVETEAYTSEPYYKINAKVAEEDSHQQELCFELLSGNAKVDFEGNVTFDGMGKCQIRIFVKDNPKIEKIVTIEYTRVLKGIKFGEMSKEKWVGEYIDLVVEGNPIDVEFEYEVSVDDSGVGLIREVNGRFRLIGQKSGKVEVTARVKGEDMEAKTQFVFYDKVTDLKLELDETGDKNGQGEYRVFGNKFFANGEITDKYTMNVDVRTSNGEQERKDLLEWSSDNEGVASVDASGVVTFNGTGRVKITVKQKAPAGWAVASDSYEFIVVEGINVWDLAGFKVATAKLKEMNQDRKDNLASLVIHDDIRIGGDPATVVLDFNIFGNGHMLSHTQSLTWALHFLIARDNVVVDNVILRGVEYNDAIQLKDTGEVLEIANCSNVLIYNTIIENGADGVRIVCSQVDFEGCIFRNCLLVGMKIKRDETKVSNIKIKDSIFTSSFCGILFVMDLNDNPNENVVTLEGEVRFYNWSTLKQIEQCVDISAYLQRIGISFLSSEIYKQLEQVASEQGTNFGYKYNGETYYNFGIFKLSAEAMSKKVAGAGRYNISKLSPTCTYTDFSFSGAFNFGVAVPFSCSVLTLTNNNPFIKPGDNYLLDPSWHTKTKQPCRV